MLPGLVQVKAGYPVLGDTDPRNYNAAADYWTWAFEISGLQHGPLVASTGWITNYASGAPSTSEPVGFAWNDILQLRSDQIATVFVNAKTSVGCNVAYALDEVQALSATAATYTQRATRIAVFPAGRRAGPNQVHCDVVEGTPFYLMMRITGETGAPLTVEEVLSLTLRFYRENRATGQWDEVGQPAAYAVEDAIAVTPIANDPRWPHGLPYNFGAWIMTEEAAPGQRLILEPEIVTKVGRVEPPSVVVTILPRAGRYSV